MGSIPRGWHLIPASKKRDGRKTQRHKETKAQRAARKVAESHLSQVCKYPRGGGNVAYSPTKPMKEIAASLLVLLISSFCFAQTPDVVLINGKILTNDPQFSIEE